MSYLSSPFKSLTNIIGFYPIIQSMPVTHDLSGLASNSFCRNPYNTNDINKAATIWCFTTDTSVKWQTCSPVGVIAPATRRILRGLQVCSCLLVHFEFHWPMLSEECTDGYAITNNEVRTLLEIVGYVLWVLAAIYLLLVCCLLDRTSMSVSILSGMPVEKQLYVHSILFHSLCAPQDSLSHCSQ